MCALQGVRSDAVFAIAICARPSKAESGVPRRIHARWMYALRSRPPYQPELRSFAIDAMMPRTAMRLVRQPASASASVTSRPPSASDRLPASSAAISSSSHSIGYGSSPPLA